MPHPKAAAALPGSVRERDHHSFHQGFGGAPAKYSLSGKVRRRICSLSSRSCGSPSLS
jgi:hypothetical protein